MAKEREFGLHECMRWLLSCLRVSKLPRKRRQENEGALGDLTLGVGYSLLDIGYSLLDVGY